MQRSAASGGESQRRLTTVLAADICGYSRLAEINESAAVKTVELVYAVFEQVVHIHRGRVFNRAGDGFFAEFPSVGDGVETALAFIADIRSRDRLSPNAPNAKVRAGLHVGDVADQPNGDLLGHGVNIAARLQGEAEPNGVLISQAAYHLVQDQVDANFKRRGAIALKNIDQPVIAYEVARGPQKRFNIRLFQRFSAMPLGVKVVIFLLALFLTANFFVVMENLTGRGVSRAETADADLRNQESTELANAILSRQNEADDTQLFAVRDAAESLANSQSEEKRNAAELIKAGKIEDAVSLLHFYYQDLVEENADEMLIIETLRELGALTFYSDKEIAMEAYARLYEMSGETDGESLIRLANLQLEASDRDEARRHYQHILESDFGPKIRTNAIIGLGRIHLRQGEFEEAEKLLLQALALSEKNSFPVEKARTLLFLNFTASSMDDYDLAAKRLREALTIERSLKPPLRSEHRIAAIHFNMAADFFNIADGPDSPDLDRSLKEYETALAISEKNNDRRTIVRALYNMGIVYSKKGNTVLAEKQLNRALAVAGDEEMNNIKTYTYIKLAQIALDRNDKEAGCEALRRAQQHYALTPDKASDLTENQLAKLAEKCVD